MQTSDATPRSFRSMEQPPGALACLFSWQKQLNVQTKLIHRSPQPTPVLDRHRYIWISTAT